MYTVYIQLVCVDFFKSTLHPFKPWVNFHLQQLFPEAGGCPARQMASHQHLRRGALSTPAIGVPGFQGAMGDFPKDIRWIFVESSQGKFPVS